MEKYRLYVQNDGLASSPRWVWQVDPPFVLPTKRLVPERKLSGGMVEDKLFSDEKKGDESDTSHQKVHEEDEFTQKTEGKQGFGLCLGYFDGVHLGHKTLLKTLIQHCKKQNLFSLVYTFDRLPRHKDGVDEKGQRILGQGVLQDSKQREESLAALGLDYLFVQHFDETFAHLEGETFLEDLLFALKDLRYLLVGYDFHFGYQGKAGVEELRSWCEKKGIVFEVVPAVCWRGEAVHSKRIRQALAMGDLSTVKALMETPLCFDGRVERGHQTGRKLGFPTLNISIVKERCLPPYGVYVSQTHFKDQVYPSLSNLGLRPTIHEKEKKVLLETYVLEEEMLAYDEEIRVELLHFLREEKTFSSLSALQEQLKLDVKEAKKFFPAFLPRQGV